MLSFKQLQREIDDQCLNRPDTETDLARLAPIIDEL